ncbi:MAG: class I SAM-dependent methyltransferase [Solirubrobacterales bacterium]
MLRRRVALRLLGSLRGGRVVIDEGERRLTFGPPDAELRAEVEVRDPRAYAWALRGSTGWGEGYVDGLWGCDDLVALTRIAIRNLPPIDRWRRRLEPLLGPLQRAAGLVPRNTRGGARRNISAHYDLGNRLFESFLDERLIYSCAYFPRPDSSLDEAQLAKLERICDRLGLGPGDHLVEIGSGWGGLAIFAASEYGCRVTTTTISHEQHELATSRVRDAGVADRVTVLLRDYRDLGGVYDKLVSVEMIEAVGWQYFPAFFAKCSSLLRPEGAMLLQAIVIGDEAYESEKAARSFANKHVFPGGCLPSQRLIAELVERRTDMSIAWQEEISEHYVRTLAAWRERFNDAWPGLRPRGYDRRFRRLWNFYLASSQAGFAERRIRDLQILLAKPEWAPAAAPEISTTTWESTSPDRVPASR